MMVFARYVMFSEVYWHHAVRSATAMLQRAVFDLKEHSEITQSWLDMDDSSFKHSLIAHCRNRPTESCAAGLFGPTRILYKRVAQFDSFCEPELHRSISKLPYAQLVELSRELSRWIQREHSIPIDPHDILIDAPPASCEVQFDLRVRLKSDQFRDLFELSPVVQSLATRQFDEMVKRVRVFVHPRLQASIKKVNIAEMLREICVRIEI
jgi:HD superfamily phosphohydrolase